MAEIGTHNSKNLNKTQAQKYLKERILKHVTSMLNVINSTEGIL